MTILELLELLVKGKPLTPEQKADARDLLRDLKAINAFGIATSEIHGKHVCIPRLVESANSWKMTRRYYICEICERKLSQ